jgi:hypothetical protein
MTGVFLDERACLVDALPIDEHLAGQNQRLRASARRAEAARDEELVDAADAGSSFALGNA